MYAKLLTPSGSPLFSGASYPPRYVRHPIYAGLLGFAFGLSLLTESPVRFAASLTLLLFLAKKMEREEAALSKRFGAAYADYAAKTARVIPKVF